MLSKDADLSNFAEWNPNPIIKLTADGKVDYANLMARTQFPDITTLGLSHPALKGLDNIIRDFKPTPTSEVAVYSREVDLNQKYYEQLIFGIPTAGIYVYLMDVTERKQLKAQAHLNDKMATIGMLAAGVAHEINNPITWVLGNISLLQNFTYKLNSILSDMDAERPVMSELQELIIKIDETVIALLCGVGQVRDITQSLKGLSRIEKNEIVPIDIHKVLNMAITMASLEFKHRAKLEIQFAHNIPSILSNPGKLNQVFVNLLINAAQAIPQGNTQNNKITVSTHLEKNVVRIDIKDTGKGMSTDVLARIFEPFFTTKPSGQGTGLGLSICKEIINELKGQIMVKTVVDQGTIFSVYLPLSATASVMPAKPEEARTAKNKKHILLIDNEPMLLRLMQRILEGENQITTSANSASAMKLIAQNGKLFDIIITDMNMPDMSGADLYHYAAEKFPGLEKRFVFITGGVDMPWVREFLTTIDNPVLEKPFLPKDIIKIVDEMTHQ